MVIKIYANDGKEFKGSDYISLVNELNAYEADLRLKKQKEDAERKINEEKQKKLTQYKEAKLKEINEVLQKVKELIDTYEKETGNKLIYAVNYCGGGISVREARNSIDFAWDNTVEEILKVIHSK